MESLNDPLLTFWRSYGDWGFRLVIIGVIGEVLAAVIDFVSEKSWPVWHKRWKGALRLAELVSGSILIIGLAMEYRGHKKETVILDAENRKLRQVAARAETNSADSYDHARIAEQKAAEANERAAFANERAKSNELQVTKLTTTNQSLLRYILEIAPRRISPSEQRSIINNLLPLRSVSIKVISVDDWEPKRLALQMSFMLDRITIFAATNQTLVDSQSRGPLLSAKFLIPDGVTVEALRQPGSEPVDSSLQELINGRNLADAIVRELTRIGIKATRRDFFHDVEGTVSHGPNGIGSLEIGTVVVWIGTRPDVGNKTEGLPFNPAPDLSP